MHNGGHNEQILDQSKRDYSKPSRANSILYQIDTLQSSLMSKGLNAIAFLHLLIATHIFFLLQ